MLINARVGGTPGKDCGGFCKFCYYKTTNFNYLDSGHLGCKYCPPDRIGCTYCHGFIRELKNGFKPVNQVLSNLLNVLSWYESFGTLNYSDLTIITSSYADIVFYPQLTELVSALKDWGLKVHLGYTSGKGISDERPVEKLISTGVDEINFSVFSTDPHMRRKWMGDKTPEQSLNALEIFCENMDVNATAVVIPGVLDESDIFRTCSMLEDLGIKSFMLTRFANSKSQGLILNNRPIMKGVKPQPFAEFQELVRKVSDEFSFTVSGSPFIDPDTHNNPYKLSKKRHEKYLKRLPPVTCEATVITSKLSFKPLEKIFAKISEGLVNIIGVEQEIADLITEQDLLGVNLKEVKKRVIIPGGALVHDKVAHEILNKDGDERSVVRGPNNLFYCDFEMSNKEEALEYELRSFKALINIINSS